MQAQDRLSKLSGGGPDEIAPIFVPGMLVLTNHTTLGIIRVVSASDSPDQASSQADCHTRKTCQVILLSCERECRTRRSSPRLEDPESSSTEQV